MSVAALDITGYVEFFDCAQGSDEWRQLRCGIPTASRASDVMAGGEGKVRGKYMRQLAGERITGQPREESYKSAAMERGSDMEGELRDLYALESGETPTPCGFAKRRLPVGFVGCSPDSLLGNDGILEIKSAAPDILIEIFEAGRAPPEHIAQCQCSMLVLDRAFCLLAIGYSGMPMFRRKIRRDDAYISRLKVGLQTFNTELNELVIRVEGYA